MKKITALVLCIIIIAALFTGCGNNTGANSKKLNIVTTIFPVYDWIRNITGDNAEITMLLDSGVDLHSYQPTADDIIKISVCDVFVYVGGESDEWVDDALRDVSNKNMIKVDLMEVLSDNLREEEEKEGMQEEDHGEEEEEGPEYDEHIWLSLKNAAAACKAIKAAVCKADPDNSAAYEANAEAYGKKIDDLDKEYEQAAEAATVKTLVFADRFPFAYMFADYGLDYYAAFKGCSAETEASFETIIFLAGKVDELGLKNIMCIESADGSIARTVKENTKDKDQNIVKMNSLQSVTAKDLEKGADYLKIMGENLSALKSVIA